MDTVIWLCATAACVIFGVMLHSVATFRSNSPRRGHSLIEVGWALVPILIVVAAAMPSLRMADDAEVVIAATD